MKRYKLRALVLLIILGLLCVCAIGSKDNTVERFDLADYQEYIDRYSTTMTVGEINDRKTAVQEASNIFLEMFGEDAANYETYWVGFDSNHDVWYIAALAADPSSGAIVFGGGPEALIKSNGEVLAVWYSK